MTPDRNKLQRALKQTNNNNRICIALYGRKFRGAESERRAVSLKTLWPRAIVWSWSPWSEGRRRYHSWSVDVWFADWLAAVLVSRQLAAPS